MENKTIRVVRQAATLENGEAAVMYGLVGKGLDLPCVTEHQSQAQHMANLLNTPDLAPEHLFDVAQDLVQALYLQPSGS